MPDHRIDRTYRLERLIEVSRNLNANLDLEPYLKSIIEVASELTFSQETSILEIGEEGDHLHYIAAPWYRIEKLRPLKYPAGQKHCWLGIFTYTTISSSRCSK